MRNVEKNTNCSRIGLLKKNKFCFFYETKIRQLILLITLPHENLPALKQKNKEIKQYFSCLPDKVEVQDCHFSYTCHTILQRFSERL